MAGGELKLPPPGEAGTSCGFLVKEGYLATTLSIGAGWGGAMPLGHSGPSTCQGNK